MKPAPDGLYKDIMIFGTKADPPKIGGWMLGPDIARSYLLAARHVIEGGVRAEGLPEVALPAAHLQRHAVEVALKDVIEAARSLKIHRDWLDGPMTAPAGVPAPVAFTHILGVSKEPSKPGLLEQARIALEEVAFEPLPEAVVEVVMMLDKIDANDPSRFRYSHVKERDENGRSIVVRSFKDATLFPLVERQELLEAVYYEHLLAEYQGRENFGGQLATECDGISQIVTRHEYERGFLD